MPLLTVKIPLKLGKGPLFVSPVYVGRTAVTAWDASNNTTPNSAIEPIAAPYFNAD